MMSWDSCSQESRCINAATHQVDGKYRLDMAVSLAREMNLPENEQNKHQARDNKADDDLRAAPGIRLGPCLLHGEDEASRAE